jgi:glucokinase
MKNDSMRIIAGIDLGGTAVNYTLLDEHEKFLIDGLCEHPARSKEGPAICLQQISDGLAIAAAKAGVALSDITSAGLDTPGPASAAGVFSARGSTNFVTGRVSIFAPASKPNWAFRCRT